jgi:hypothetical protein
VFAVRVHSTEMTPAHASCYASYYWPTVTPMAMRHRRCLLLAYGVTSTDSETCRAVTAAAPHPAHKRGSHGLVRQPPAGRGSVRQPPAASRRLAGDNSSATYRRGSPCPKRGGARKSIMVWNQRSLVNGAVTRPLDCDYCCHCIIVQCIYCV